MSLSNDIEIMSAVKTVAAAGTREPLAIGRPDVMRVRSVNIRGLSTNGGIVYIGDSTVSSTVGRELLANESITLQVEAEDWKHGSSINLSKIYLDVSVNGEGVSYLVLRD